MPVEKSEPFILYNEISHQLERNGFSLNQTLLKDCLQVVMQTLMDIEVSQMLDASRYERNASRRAYRNGYRPTRWTTSIGNIELGVPKLRRGTYYPDRLLNDSNVSDMLLHLIKVCILQGIDENFVAEALSALDFMDLSAYEKHQVCDVLRSQLSQSEAESTYTNEDNLLLENFPIPYHRHRLLIRKETTDNKFWQDFARRLIDAGLIVDNEQSVLASVNPYAHLQLDESKSVIDLNFADYIHPLYEEDYLLIA